MFVTIMCVVPQNRVQSYCFILKYTRAFVNRKLTFFTIFRKILIIVYLFGLFCLNFIYRNKKNRPSFESLSFLFAFWEFTATPQSG